MDLSVLRQLLMLNEQIDEVKIEQHKYATNRFPLPTIGGSLAADLDSSDNEAYTPYSCLSTSETPYTPCTGLTTGDSEFNLRVYMKTYVY